MRNILAAQAHTTAFGTQQAQNHFEERSLSAAVGAKQAHYLARIKRKLDLVHHGPGPVAACHALQGQVHASPPRSRINRKRKNGAPIERREHADRNLQ